MRLRITLVVLSSTALLACSSAIATAPVARTEPFAAYASAVEESVRRYEHESDLAGPASGVISGARYEELLGDALGQRGLTLAQFYELGHTAPRFYFTQQALYAMRLDAARVRASSQAHRLGAPTPRAR